MSNPYSKRMEKKKEKEESEYLREMKAKTEYKKKKMKEYTVNIIGNFWWELSKTDHAQENNGSEISLMLDLIKSNFLRQYGNKNIFGKVQFMVNENNGNIEIINFEIPNIVFKKINWKGELRE